MLRTEIKPNLSLASVSRVAPFNVEGCGEGSLVLLDQSYGLVVLDAQDILRLVTFDCSEFRLLGNDGVQRARGDQNARLMVLGAAVVQPEAFPIPKERGSIRSARDSLVIGTCGLMISAFEEHARDYAFHLFRLDTAREITNQPETLGLLRRWRLGVRDYDDKFRRVIGTDNPLTGKWHD